MVESKCLSCQHIVKGKAVHCTMCNGTMEVIQNERDKRCPRCQIPLEKHHYRGFELDNCQKCHGIWLQPNEFAVLTTEFDVYKDEASDPNYVRPALPKSEGYLPCANCQKIMTRRNFKSISGVLIDSCIHCGIWLDKGELQSMRNFIASGGLDKQQDNKLVSQELKTQALNDRVSDLEMMEKTLNKFSLKRIFFRGF
ncbi:zf-TFIIB domain-containing protein [Thalassotalea ganghwensis]